MNTQTHLPLEIPDCIAFWDFNRTLKDQCPSGFVLRELSNKWQWVPNGLFGPQCLRIFPGGGFHIPRSDLGSLNIFGNHAELTVCAWILRESQSPWQALAGVWDESRSKRQYYLFLNARSRAVHGSAERVDCHSRIHGHISDIGGPTPGLNCCITYATGATKVPLHKWTMVAMSYKDGIIKVYVDGKLDTCEESNPFTVAKSIFDGGADGADFSVGMNSVRGNWENHFGGLFAGLAVYSRALTDEELAGLA